MWFIVEHFLFTEPEVSMFATKETETRLKLTCQAKRLYSEDTIVQIKKSNQVLTKYDGLITSEYEPNGHGTYMRRASVMISNTETDSFSCEVSHRPSNMSVVKAWGKKFSYFIH